MLVGLIGCIIPVLPGPLLVLLGAFVYAWHTDYMVVSWAVLGVLAGLTLF